MMLVAPKPATTLELPGKRYGYVDARGVANMASGHYLKVFSGWLPARPVDFDTGIVDPHAVEHWATVRLRDLGERQGAVQNYEWRQAVGRAPMLAVAHRIGTKAAYQLLNAFGLYDTQVLEHLADWALRLPIGDFMAAQDMARAHGVAPVLATLELAGHMTMYTALAHLYRVPQRHGLVWR